MAESDHLLDVELVAADRRVWSGTARLVLARTTNGDIGILYDHEPVLAVLVDGVVTLRRAEGDMVAAVHGGFLSFANNRVSILAETAEMSFEIDVARAEQALADLGVDDDDAIPARVRAETRVKAASMQINLPG
jgi:F-type H+-transporting ATPase subunit epsilon